MQEGSPPGIKMGETRTGEGIPPAGIPSVTSKQELKGGKTSRLVFRCEGESKTPPSQRNTSRWVVVGEETLRLAFRCEEGVGEVENNTFRCEGRVGEAESTPHRVETRAEGWWWVRKAPVSRFDAREGWERSKVPPCRVKREPKGGGG